MRGSTHLVGGLAAALLAERLLGQVTSLRAVYYVGDFPVSQMLIGAAVAAFGALLPDIDEPHSTVANLPRKAEHMVKPHAHDPIDVAIGTTIEGGASFLNILTQTFSGFIRALGGGHRGATHWLIIGGLLTAAVWALGVRMDLPRMGLWFGAGYASHLVLDMLTTSGLRVLKPLYRKPIHLLPKHLRIRTGSFAEQGFRAWLLISVVWMLWRR